MLTTADAYDQALRRVATNQRVEGRLRGGWARQGLAPEVIDALLAPVRDDHAADAEAVRAYERQLVCAG